MIIDIHFNDGIVGDWVYQAYGKKTLPPMAIFAGTVIVALVGTMIFYKELTNKALSEDKKKETDAAMHATNRVYLSKYM